MSNVAFPQDPFTLTNKVRVTSITQITKQFAQDLALDLGGPWAMDTPKTEVIQTQKVIYLPARFSACKAILQGKHGPD